MLKVIKLGGASLKATLEDSKFFKHFKKSPEDRYIFVHGGGPEINELSARLGLETEFYEGLRITNSAHMKVVSMGLCGSVNPLLITGLLRWGHSAVGVSAFSGKLLECSLESPHLGLVGKVDKVHPELLEILLKGEYIPVVAPIGYLKEGAGLCNVNADLAAAAIARSMKAERLYFLTDRDGILDSQGEALAQLSSETLRDLLHSEVISGGMRVKARAILEVLDQSPQTQVFVMNGLCIDDFWKNLSQDSHSGTFIQ